MSAGRRDMTAHEARIHSYKGREPALQAGCSCGWEGTLHYLPPREMPGETRRLAETEAREHVEACEREQTS